MFLCLDTKEPKIKKKRSFYPQGSRLPAVFSGQRTVNASHLKGGLVDGDFFVIILYCIFEKQ
jgi:hypothetical protein